MNKTAAQLLQNCHPDLSVYPTSHSFTQPTSYSVLSFTKDFPLLFPLCPTDLLLLPHGLLTPRCKQPAPIHSLEPVT